TRWSPPGYPENCKFTAVPGNLTINTAYGTNRREASWLVPPLAEQAPGTAHLIINFAPLPNSAPFSVVTTQTGIMVEAEPALIERMHSARVELDGADIGMPVTFEIEETIQVTGRRFPAPLPERGFVDFDASQQKLVAERMSNRKTAELLLFDKDGKLVARYRWDISKLVAIRDLIDRVGWSCSAPPRK
ncbi:MAG: hypothetical protein ACAH11_10935, partial [Sphingomonas sp.]